MIPCDHLARGRIDMAQFRAGREFQRHFAIADKRRPADLEQERPGALTVEQQAAWKWLARCYKQLGLDGSSIVCGMLVDGMSIKKIAESRGKTGQQWEKFFSMRLGECLNTLAAVYGFSNEDRRSKGAYVSAVRAAESRRGASKSFLICPVATDDQAGAR
jgi:hypothetical protein